MESERRRALRKSKREIRRARKGWKGRHGWRGSRHLRTPRLPFKKSDLKKIKCTKLVIKMKRIFFYTEYSRAAKKDNFKLPKRKFVSTYSGLFLKN
jgi:hypothetical protein